MTLVSSGKIKVNVKWLWIFQTSRARVERGPRDGCDFQKSKRMLNWSFVKFCYELHFSLIDNLCHSVMLGMTGSRLFGGFLGLVLTKS